MKTRASLLVLPATITPSSPIVHDILTVVHYVKNQDRKSETITLVGLGGTGPLVAAARAQSRDAVDRAVIDTGGFRFGKLLNIHDVDFLPGGAKYGDLPGMLALGAPGQCSWPERAQR